MEIHPAPPQLLLPSNKKPHLLRNKHHPSHKTVYRCYSHLGKTAARGSPGGATPLPEDCLVTGKKKTYCHHRSLLPEGCVTGHPAPDVTSQARPMIQGDLPSSSLPLAQDVDLFPAFTSKKISPCFQRAQDQGKLSCLRQAKPQLPLIRMVVVALLLLLVCFKITKALFIHTHKSTALTVQGIHSLFLCRSKKKD